MADDTLNLPQRPPSWSDAFAALPLEAAPSAAWQRMQTTLDASVATKRRHAPPRWLAAAALAALALLPWAWFAYAPQRHGENTVQQSAPQRRHSATLPFGPAADPRPTTARVADAPAVAAQADATQRTASPRASAARNAHRVARAARRPRDATARALARVAGTRANATTVPDTHVAAVNSTQALETLYAESARLEALLQLTRDERVASAASTVLTDAADTRVQLIDAALSQASLTQQRRTELWEQRVAALRDLAGVASTTRWLAAHGEQLEDAIVRVD